jgi:hypothetical protein
MRRLTAISLAAALVACHPAQHIAPRPGGALASTWRLLSVENRTAGGSVTRPYGDEPVGQLTLDRGGRYSVQIFRPGRARFASNDKARGTVEENRALVQGTNSHFGTYVVDPAAGTIEFRIASASFPNWEGTVQRRSYAIRGDTLRYTVRTTTTGGSETAEVAWVRLRP